VEGGQGSGDEDAGECLMSLLSRKLCSVRCDDCCRVIAFHNPAFISSTAVIYSRSVSNHSSKLIVSLLTTKIREVHDLDHQASPASEMLCPLALAGIGIVLLPSKARLFPALVHSLDKICAELGVHLRCFLLLRTGGLRDVLSSGLVCLSERPACDPCELTSRFLTTR